MHLESSTVESLHLGICEHCGQPSAARFCCNGCEAVSSYIKECRLEDFYRLKGSDLLAPANEAEVLAPSYLDQPLVRAHYLVAPNTIEFFVQGLQCAACVWLLEKIPDVSKGSVAAVKVDAARNTVLVTLAEDSRFGDFLKIPSRLGFKLRPLRKGESLIDVRRQEGRRELLRLAVTFVAMGNIMMFSAGVYFGADPSIARFFSWLSLALFIPVISFGAAPLWAATVSALRLRRPSVELPVVLALVAGTALSLFQILQGRNETYFDSMSALIFLLLAGRFLVRRLQDKFFEHQSATNRLDVPFARLLAGAEVLPVSSVKVDDLLLIFKQEKLPADCVVVEGEGWVDQSLLTGEPLPRRLAPGEEVFAGTLLVEGRLVAKVLRPLPLSRLALIQESASQAALSKGVVHHHLEVWSQNFSWVVLSMAALLCGYGAISSQSDFYLRALALLIVACPCAIALAAPLIYSMSLRSLAQKGVFISNVDVFSKIPGLQNIVFDKTGTLTAGRLRVVDIQGELSVEDQAIVAVLESGSSHPIARSLCHHFSKVSFARPTLSKLEILLGQGVQGEMDGVLYSLTKSKSHLPQDFGDVQIWIDYRKNGRLQAQICLSDSLRPESTSVIRQAKEWGLDCWILSGDRQANVRSVARTLHIPEAHAIGDLSPEQKAELIQNLPAAMMVGDGFNDSTAIAKSAVGVVVGGALEKAMDVGDVFLSSESLQELPSLWPTAHNIEVSLGRIKKFSIAYNLGSGTLAVLGLASPLIAAILMPSASVLLILISTHSMRKIWKS